VKFKHNLTLSHWLQILIVLVLVILLTSCMSWVTLGNIDITYNNDVFTVLICCWYLSYYQLLHLKYGNINLAGLFRQSASAALRRSWRSIRRRICLGSTKPSPLCWSLFGLGPVMVIVLCTCDCSFLMKVEQFKNVTVSSLDTTTKLVGYTNSSNYRFRLLSFFN